MDSTAAALMPVPKAAPLNSPTAALTLANVLYEKKGAIAYVTVNRPKVLNALNMATMEDLRAAFTAIKDDREVRVAEFLGIGEAVKPPRKAG